MRQHILLLISESYETCRNLYNGDKKPHHCPLPCRTFHINTKFISSIKTSSGPDRAPVKIVFSQSVLVTKTDFVKPSLSSLLSGVGGFFFGATISIFKSENQVGGSMGLWLGLGILQALQHFFTITIIIAIIITIVITIIIIPIIIVIIVIVIPPGIAAGWRRLQGLDWTFQQKEAEECWKNS